MFNALRTSTGPQIRAFSSARVVLGPTPHATKLTRAGLPIPPRRPASAYTLFVSDYWSANRERLEKGMKQSDIQKTAEEVSQAFKNLSESERSAYNSKMTESYANYATEFKKFYSALSPGQIKQIESITGKTLRVPGSRDSLRKAKREAEGRTAKPLSAFFLYLNHVRGTDEFKSEKMSAIVSAKAAAEKWRELSQEEKQPFLDQAEQLKAEYTKANPKTQD